MIYASLDRLREAIECLKRALIGADPHESSIRTRLAGLHNELSEFAEAASYHKYIVDTLVADSAYLFRISIPPFILRQRFFVFSCAPVHPCRPLRPCPCAIGLLGRFTFFLGAYGHTTDRPVNEYATSSVYVAKYHCQQGGGDLELAKAYMERVASSNSASAIQAGELLKKIKNEMGKVAASEAAKPESQEAPSAEMQLDTAGS